MNRQSEEMRRDLEELFEGFPDIHVSDIPGIDLYMDQVTTFLQEKLRGIARDPEGDKFLTKTMINNYVKNKVLIPPVKKKYSRDHMMLLIMIYYMKSFLSISDIHKITGPLMERYAAPSVERPDKRKEPQKEPQDRRKESADRRGEATDRKSGTGNKSSASGGGRESGKLRIPQIYEEIIGSIDEDLVRIRSDIEKQIDLAAEDFADAPEEEQDLLQRFSLICRLSCEVYMRKRFIESLLDDTRNNI